MLLTKMLQLILDVLNFWSFNQQLLPRDWFFLGILFFGVTLILQFVQFL